MFNKFSRTCALSDELEKGSVLYSPLFRFLSFAVCLALMLCIFSIMPFPASAESGISCVGVSAITSYGTYNGFNIYNNNKIRACSLSSIYKLYGDCCVFAVLKCGDNFYLPSFSGNSNAFSCIEYYIHGDGQYIYSYTNSSRDQYIYKCTDTSHFLHCGLKIDDTGLLVTDCEGSHYIKRIFDFNGHDVTSAVDLSNSTCMWAIYPNRDWDTLNNNVGYNLTPSLLSSISDGSGFLPASARPEADFVQFPVRDDNQFYMIDWISDGYQYPIFDFWINDKNNLHTYSLKFSSNSSFAQDLYDQEQKKGFNAVGYKYYSIANYLKLIGQNSIFDLQWDYVWSLSDSNLQFTNGNMKAFSINLSDYFSITKFLVYRCQIVDNNTGSIIATTYFTTNRNYNKSNSGYGSNVYEYTNKDNLITDTTNNNGYSNGYINADTSTSGNTFESDNPNDIVHISDPTNLDIDISSIFGALNQSAQGIGSFFQACFNVIPAAIISIITAAIALVVILRILGR